MWSLDEIFKHKLKLSPQIGMQICVRYLIVGTIGQIGMQDMWHLSGTIGQI